MPFVKYISDGRMNPEVIITVSVNKGVSWKTTILKAGQSYSVAGNITNLLIDNIPYNPKNNYIVRKGRVSSQ